MAGDRRILASAIANKEHLALFDDVFKNALDNIDVSAVLVNLVDIVKPSALYWLASQYDVLGYKGWYLAQTEQDQRDLVKKAIELHRTKGTPYAIKEAIKNFGYSDVTIQERILSNLQAYHNGVFRRNGTLRHGLGHWATFRVIINPGQTGEVSAQVVAVIIALINEYKNARSHLIDLTWDLSETETLNPTDEFELQGDYDQEEDLFPRHNGVYRRNGDIQHSEDVFILNIIN